MAEQCYVKYTGTAAYTDGQAGTGSWVANQIKLVSKEAGIILPSTLLFTLVSDGPTTGSTVFAQPRVPTAAAAGASPVLTAALVLDGIVTHAGQTGAVTMTMDTAANLFAALPAYIQDKFTNASAPIQQLVRIINNNTSSGIITVTAGTGGTVSGTATIAVGAWREYMLTFASATACTMTNIGGGTV